MQNGNKVARANWERFFTEFDELLKLQNDIIHQPPKISGRMKEVYEPPCAAVTLEDLTDSHPRDTVLTEDQSGFLDAVRDGNDGEVRAYVVDKSVDVNCVNLLGETALQVAVNNDRHDIAKFLVEQGADVGSALLQAVAKESIDWVKALLEFVENPKTQSSKTSPGSPGAQTSEAQLYSRYISPLMLAAQNNNQEIVRLFFEKGHTIKEPPFHNRSCKCSECETESMGERLGSSIYRLHSYRALTSPVYLCMSYLLQTSAEEKDIKSSKDPIVRAFLLNRKLENLVETEYEFKSDYRTLSNSCEEFAVSLLTKCRSMEEISCVMSVPGIDKLEHVEVRGGKEAQKLSVLNFAIANKNEKVRFKIRQRIDA